MRYRVPADATGSLDVLFPVSAGRQYQPTKGRKGEAESANEHMKVCSGGRRRRSGPEAASGQVRGLRGAFTGRKWKKDQGSAAGAKGTPGRNEGCRLPVSIRKAGTGPAVNEVDEECPEGCDPQGSGFKGTGYGGSAQETGCLEVRRRMIGDERRIDLSGQRSSRSEDHGFPVQVARPVRGWKGSAVQPVTGCLHSEC